MLQTTPKPSPTAPIEFNAATYRKVLRSTHSALRSLGYYTPRHAVLLAWLEGRLARKKALYLGRAKAENLRWFFTISCERAGVSHEYLLRRGIQPTNEPYTR